MAGLLLAGMSQGLSDLLGKSLILTFYTYSNLLVDISVVTIRCQWRAVVNAVDC